MKSLVRFRGCQQAIFRSVLGAALTAAVFQLGALHANATPLGVSTDPMGSGWNRGDANTGYAVWDSYVTTDFSTLAPSSGSGLTSPNLAQPTVFTQFAQGAGIYDSSPIPGTTPPASPGDIIFTGGNQVNFTITGALGDTIHGLTLQIKRAGSTVGMADANGFAPTLSINGGSALLADQITLTSGSGDTTSSAGTWSVSTWYWNTSLAGNNVTGSNTFSLLMSKTLTRSIDTMAIDVGNTAAVVPEPSTWAMLFVGGLAALVYGARARRARQS